MKKIIAQLMVVGLVSVATTSMAQDSLLYKVKHGQIPAKYTQKAKDIKAKYDTLTPQGKAAYKNQLKANAKLKADSLVNAKKQGLQLKAKPKLDSAANKLGIKAMPF